MSSFNNLNLPGVVVTGPIAKRIGERLGNEIVTLYVGLACKKFTVHKALLCESSDFFKKGFMGGFKEAQEKEMSLPEDNPEAFSLFLDWLYTHTLPICSTEAQLDDLYRLYFFAEKICQMNLADKAIDRIQQVHKYNPQLGIKPAVIGLVFANTKYHSSLQRLVIHIFLYDIIKDKIVAEHPALSKDHVKAILELGKEDMNIPIAYFESVRNISKMTQAEKFRVADPRDASGCYYHSHDSIEKKGIICPHS